MTSRTGLFATKVTRERLSEQVAARIQDLITSGEIEVDDRLPSEHDLARQMGVSRTVIREAIKALEEKGLVRTVTGSGTYVSRVNADNMSESIGLFIEQNSSTFEDFYELRRILEVEIAALASDRATSQDIISLEKAVRRVEEIVAAGSATPDLLEDFVQADLEFHNLLAKATHNPLLLVIQELAPEQLLDFIRLTARAAEAVERTLSDHRKILEGVMNRDAQVCRRLMREHIDRGMQELSTQEKRR
ncbi:MAG: FadR family transcriptional regulator [Chloroflexi bacterium]|nr:FadR family transcriptional regulator [Chloroflexota bacterium]